MAEQKSIDEIAGEVKGLRSTPPTAVKKALEVAPHARACKDEGVRNAARDTVLSALETVKDSQAAPLVEGLTDDEADVLLAYVYKAMDVWSADKDDAKRCSMLLKMHDAIVTRRGTGVICRVMCDRKL